MVKVGESCREFKLDDQHYRPVSNSDYEGKIMLLSFHPLAWTNVCAKQMVSLEKNCERFEKLNTVALGLSVDSSPCKLAWAKSLGISKTRLLSDFWPHGEISRRYGLFDEKEGTSKRANVILDESRKVLFAKLYPSSELPDIEQVITFLEAKK